MKAMVVVCVIAGAIALHAASAKENYRENGVKADTKESFEPIAANVREELAPGGQYEYATVEEKKSVEKKLSEMDALFQAAGSVAAMTQDQKIALFNAQEVVNSILTKRDKDRVICKNQAPVGSHIPVTSCHTYGQEVEARRGTQRQLTDWQSTKCVGKCS